MSRREEREYTEERSRAQMRELATPKQLAYLDAVDEHGSARAAATHLGVHHSNISRTLQRLRVKVADRRTEPHRDPEKVAPGFRNKGFSTQRRIWDGASKKWIVQWQKTERDNSERLLELHEMFRDLPAIEPVPEVQAPETACEDDLAAVFLLGDPHFGMIADPDVTRGEKYDLMEAHDVHVRSVQSLVSKSPRAATGVLISCGDTGHTDNGLNKTRKSGHALDVTGPFSKIARQTVESFSTMVDLMLRKFERVIVHLSRGNHDPDFAIWLGLCLEQRYRLNPRVSVDVEESKFWYWRHGRVLIGVTHGDTVPHKGPTLSEIMAHDCAALWGKVEWRHWYVGHVHHRELQERIGVTVETMQTLAPGDSHSAGRYRSGRSMRCDVYSKDGLESQIWERGIR